MDQLAEALAGAVGPAWILDIDRGLMVGANAAGSAAWGLTSTTPDAALVLDRAMPALVRLVELANASTPPTEPERLTFWTRRGPFTRLCDVRLLSTSPGARLALIAAVDQDRGRRPPPGRVAAGGGSGEGAAKSSKAPRPPTLRDASLSAGDAAALREIARRIRRDSVAATASTGPAAPGLNAQPERRSLVRPLSEPASFLNQARAAARRSENGIAAGQSAPLRTNGLSSTAGPPVGGGSASTSVEQQSVESPLARKERAQLAHELKTPLAAIASLAEVLQGEHLGPLPNAQYRDYAGSIRESALHALTLVERLLSSDQAGSAKPELVFAELDLNAEVEACMAALGALAARTGARLDAALVSGLPRVIADHQSVQQMLMNLVSNSLRHGGQGVRIRVGTGYRLAGEVWLEIEDTGPGFDAAAIAAASETADGRAAGEQGAGGSPRAGLGLPLTRDLARLNGARLELTSEPGRGTLARIIFAPDRVIPV